MNAEFLKSCSSPKDFPPTGLPEIAFIGRSNCGKSSLINSICNKKKLARTSSTPGRTQLVNIFSLNDKYLFVDLPGYGFAKVSAGERKKWQSLIQSYLERPSIKYFLVLADIRRKIGETEDELLMHYKEKAVCILTKADKVNQSEAAKAKKAVEKLFPELNVFPTSTMKAHSVQKLRDFLDI